VLLTITYTVVKKGVKCKGVNDASIGAAVVGEKAHLRMKQRKTVKKSSL